MISMEKRHFKVVKDNKIKKVVGSLAIALGIVLPVSCTVAKEEPAEVTKIEQSVQGKNISEAEDVLVFAWADETSAKIDALKEENYLSYMESFTTYQSEAEQDLAQIYLKYYSYLEYKEMDEPAELMGNVVESTYKKFRSAAYNYNSDISEEYKFENSIYAEGIVKIEDELIAETSKECIYYLPLNRVISEERLSNEYSISNLPDGSIIENGQVYVSIETIRNEKNKSLS